MPLQLAVDVLVVKAFDIVGEPFVPEGQLSEERRFARSLVADEAEHVIELTAWVEYTCDAAEQEQLHTLVIEIIYLRTEKMMKYVPYALFPVPQRRKEHIAYGVIPLFVRDDINCGNSLFFSRDAVSPVQIEPNVIDVCIRQWAALIPLPAELFRYMDPAAHFIKVNGII